MFKRHLLHLQKVFLLCSVCMFVFMEMGTTKSNVKSHFHDKSTSFKLKMKQKKVQPNQLNCHSTG